MVASGCTASNEEMSLSVKLKLLHVNCAHELLLIIETLLSNLPSGLSLLCGETRTASRLGNERRCRRCPREKQTSHLQRGHVSPAPGHLTQAQCLRLLTPNNCVHFAARRFAVLRYKLKVPPNNQGNKITKQEKVDWRVPRPLPMGA